MTRPDEVKDPFEVKGWCPGALRPMASGDGLLVRVRLTAGVLKAPVARALAKLSETAGNGLIDHSQRGNLQLRGVREERLTDVHAKLRSLEVLDHDAEHEAIRNLVVSPLAGPETLALVRALERTLATSPDLVRLPGKFGFLIDDGSWPRPAGVEVDIRFIRRADRDEGRYQVCLPFDVHGITLGAIEPAEIPAVAAKLAGAFIEWRGAHGRMAGLMQEPDMARTLAEAAGIAFSPSIQPPEVVPDVVGLRDLPDGRKILGLGVPFGQWTARQMKVAADVADDYGVGDIRLTPFRAALMEIDAEVVEDAKRSLSAAGFILDAADPRLTVVSCAGAPDCLQGDMPSRTDAQLLADVASRLAGSGVRLHVSGCAKGCARPGRTRVTLVGRAGGYDLVLDGTPLDRPRRKGLDLAAARDMLIELGRE
jgi:precorrin-3B synthase